jgi:hypothetical protein
MSSAEETGQTGRHRWLGTGLRLLVTFLFLLLILALSRCGLPSPVAVSTPTQAAATAKLRIEVSPPGANIFVNGLGSGTTPAALTLPPGQHTVRVQKDGYEPLVQTVNLAADSNALVSGELVPLAVSPRAAATPMSFEAPETEQSLPDLVVQHSQIELESGGACDYASTQLGVRVWIQNAGPVDAGPFVVEVNGVQQAVPEGLPAGETISLWFEGYVHEGENVIRIDATSQIEEGDEGDNVQVQRLPMPTLPPTCTPPPTVPPTAPATSPPATPTSLPPTATPAPTPPSPAAVTMQEGEITIPTYPYANFATPAWNETFNLPYPVLDWGAYDASGPRPANVTYRTFVVENEYLQLTFLPEVGGRLYQVVYKPTGHTVTYRNPVLKPTHWGPVEQGWWLAAGGFEWALPVEEHGYQWGVPWTLSANHDGNSVTVTLRDSRAEDRVRAEIDVRLEAGAPFFTIRPRLENPTGAPLEVKYWTNAMLAPGGRNAPSADLHFVLPDAVTAVTVHSRGDDSLPDYNEEMSWPVYGGVDYSRLGNWNRWLGFFEDPALDQFIAVYDTGYDEGVVRVFSADEAPGAKAFAFGWKDPISPGNWTDDGSSYVEIHGGPAATFDDAVTIPGGGHLQWTETWYPVAGLGGLRYANSEAALNLTAGGGRAQVAAVVTHPWSGDLVLLLDGQEIWRQSASLSPGQPFREAVALGNGIPETGNLTLRLEAQDDAVLAEYGTDMNLK